MTFTARNTTTHTHVTCDRCKKTAPFLRGDKAAEHWRRDHKCAANGETGDEE